MALRPLSAHAWLSAAALAAFVAFTPTRAQVAAPSQAPAQAGAGKLANGPLEVPGGARIAQLVDPSYVPESQRTSIGAIRNQKHI